MGRKTAQEQEFLLGDERAYVEGDVQGSYNAQYQSLDAIQKEENGQNESGGSLVGSIVNLSNAVLGSGVLSFGYAFLSAGILGGFVMMIVMLSVTMLTVDTVLSNAHRMQVRSYQRMIRLMYGGGWEVFVIVCVILFAFGTNASYMIVIGDEAVPVIQRATGLDPELVSCGCVTAPVYVRRWFIQLLACCGLIFPLLMLKKISLLSYTSFAAAASVIYMTALVVTYSLVGAYDATDQRTPGLLNHSANFSYLEPEHYRFLPSNETAPWVQLWPSSISAINALPIIAFSFQCHLSSVPIYFELQTRTMTRARIVYVSTFTLCATLYSLAGIFGYLSFGGFTVADILENFSNRLIPVEIARVGMSLVGVVSYPIFHYVARIAVIDVVNRVREMAFGHEIVEEDVRKAGFLISRQEFLVSTVWFTATLLVGLTVQNIDIVVGIVGGVLASIIMFIVPGSIMFLRTPKDDKYYNVRRVFGIFSMCFGVTVLGLSLAVSIMSDIQGPPPSECPVCNTISLAPTPALLNPTPAT